MTDKRPIYLAVVPDLFHETREGDEFGILRHTYEGDKVVGEEIIWVRRLAD